VVFGDNVGVRAFRNIFGLDIANVNALNLLSLAPGGHLGRFLIWTKSAFAQLGKIFGTFTQESAVKYTKYKVHADGAFAKGRNELHDAITDLFDLHGQHCFDKCGDEIFLLQSVLVSETVRTRRPRDGCAGAGGEAGRDRGRRRCSGRRWSRRWQPVDPTYRSSEKLTLNVGNTGWTKLR
jgi:hypothetical protein